MEKFPRVAGACGEIEVLVPDKKENGDQFTFVENAIMQAQYVEYKLSHYIDKAYESLFGFISVLPGAFSTFRWEAICGSPLDAFLKGKLKEGDPNYKTSCPEANMYLAEDRIFCLELLIKAG
jgi:chitin synthase